MQEKITPISELGEFALIDLLTKNNNQRNVASLKLTGDDASQLAISEGEHTLISTDMMVHGVHFDLGYFPPQHLGYKAIVSAISDIYAMNGQPKQVLLSIAASSKISVEFLELMYEGVYAACNDYNVDLAGGDTTTVHRGLILNITAIGTAKPERVVYRSGAQENDLICVSGDLGAAYLGLQLLEREKQVFHQNPEVQPELNEDYEYLYQRFLRPDTRNDIVKKLAETGVLPTAMIDISDGLSSDVLHITKQSNVGCRIYENKLPIHHNTTAAAEDFNLSPITCALNGGEDYELLFTVSPSHFEAVNKMAEVSIIGHITPKDTGCKMITNAENEFDLVAQGWEPFGSERG
ncbi:MAG: thiamine-phosphate kinase [Bacteroidetes bacterium]|nr:thiamine-phosphate kinase [Bacteroidota bacterium]